MEGKKEKKENKEYVGKKRKNSNKKYDSDSDEEKSNSSIDNIDNKKKDKENKNKKNKDIKSSKKKEKNYSSSSESDSENVSNKKEKKEKQRKKSTSSSKKQKRKSSQASIKSIESSKPTINPYTNEPYSDNFYKLLNKRRTLPAYERKKEILKLIENNQILIIQGETGSGKTTQIPQFLLENGYDQGIAVTQPRRVAAMSVAKRVAEEMDLTLGKEIGYTVRFDDKSNPETLIKYLTDGMLLREAIVDKLLNKYQVIILDEAHERTLSTDILFGFLKVLLGKRKELKLIIMSATLDIEKFKEFFNAPVIVIPGRTFPVEVIYTKSPVDDYYDSAIDKVVEIHKENKEGDILLFLTGEEEIESACADISAEIEALDKVGPVDVIPLYSTLPPYQQQKIFGPPPKGNKYGPGRKIIIATNIAESSITIDGIVYVVDPGFSKQKVYNARTKIESLLVQPISQDNADQRAGRAGRTRPGKCYRLYTENSFKNELRKTAIPEILRSNITSVILNLKKLGIDDIVNFDFIDPPTVETTFRALEMLLYLGAIDDENGELTDLGSKMSQLPLEPEYAKILFSGEEYSCLNECLTIVSMLNVQRPFYRPKNQEKQADAKHNKFTHHLGDHFTLLNIFTQYKLNGEKKQWCNDHFLNYRTLSSANDVRNQLSNMLGKMGINVDYDYDFTSRLNVKKCQTIIKCLVSGMFAQVAHLESSGYYITIRDNQIGFLHPGSVLASIKPNWIIYNEFVLTKKNYIRTCTSIEPEVMLEICPDYFDPEKLTGYAYKRELINVKRQMEKEKEKEMEKKRKESINEEDKKEKKRKRRKSSC